MLVEFEFESGRLVAINAKYVSMVSPRYHVEYYAVDKSWRFWVAGLTEIELSADACGGDTYTVLGNYRDVVFRIQEAQSYGQG